MFKRPRDIFDSPSSSSPPCAKRFQSGSSSHASSSAFSSPSKGFSTPSRHSIPSDSPSNPFSLKVAHILNLPIALRTSKHLELRFQLVHTEPATSKRLHVSYRSLQKLTSRLVLVPPNYSFKLLYKLILFLFDLDASLEHVFEIQEDVEAYPASANKPGYVKKGKTKLKLSRNFDDQLKAEKGKGKEKAKVPVSKDGVEWEGEDDYHLGRVWPLETEDSKKKAILYHHDEMDSVHITLSKSGFERKKSRTNRPFVITARDPEGPVEDCSVWNRGRSFERFLTQAMNEEKEAEEDSDSDGFDVIPRSDTPIDPFSLITPYPSEPLLQKRLESANRRLSRELPAKKSGDESSSSEPSSEEDEVRARKPKSVQSEEDEKEKKDFIDDWDPFGDEAEL